MIKMEEDWTANLPKLLPSWHSNTPNFLARYKHKHCTKERLPDSGGTGVDVSNDESELKIEVSKYGIDQVNFGAQNCALPCFTNRKAHQLQDPCLEDIKKQIVNFESFSNKLCAARRMLNHKRSTWFRKEVMDSHKLIKDMSLSGEFEKISLSQNVVELANILPKTEDIIEINYQYSGGCLAALNKGSKSPILLHPFGPKLNKLAASPLIETSDSYQAFKMDESKRTLFNLKGGCIQQVKPAVDGFCYVKQENRCHLIDLEASEVHGIPYFEDNTIKNMSPSPFIPTEYFCIHEDGNISLNDIDESEPLWKTDHLFFTSSYLNEKPIACDFGSQTRSILYLDRKGVFTYDLRLKGYPTLLFSCYESMGYMNQSFVAMKRLSINPFQHLAFTNHYLFLLDERYPKKPILIWNHLLNGSPLYCDITTYDSTFNKTDAVILLATQESRELASFVLRTEQSKLQAVSLAPPLSLSSVTDWADSLRFHGHSINDQVIKRTSCPIVGVCAVPHNGKPAFTAFQVTSVGDVFYQDFQRVSDPGVERTYKVGMGCVLPTPEKIIPHVADLMNSFDDEIEDKSACNLNRINVDIRDILKAPLEISDWCTMCQSFIPNSDEKIVSIPVCPSCGLEELQSEKLHRGWSELDLLTGDIKESSQEVTLDNMTELLNFTDTYSKRILNVWTSTEEFSEQYPTEIPEYKPDPMDITIPTSANASYSEFSTQYEEKPSSSQLRDSYYQSSQSLFEDSMFSESMIKQESMDEYVPPSQDVRSKVGETLRSAKKLKTFSQLNSSNAGF